MNRQERETLEYLSKTLIPDLYKRLTVAENRIKELEARNERGEIWHFANEINQKLQQMKTNDSNHLKGLFLEK